VEVRPARLVDRHELTVELYSYREIGAELGQKRRHVPAAPAPRSEAVMREDAAPEPVQLRLEDPAAAARDRSRSGEHRFGQP
jgi:hypothetical protein